MSGDELTHRLIERWRAETDRVRARFGWDGDSGLAALIRRQGSLKNYFQRGPAGRFYASSQDPGGTSEFIRRRFPEWFELAVSQAEALCEHRVNLLGHTNVALGGRIDWHRDPISGYTWPRRYWAGYDLVHSPPADAKVIHELNRHQHLPRLGKAYLLTGDERYAGEAVSQFASWIEQNPRWIGIHWQSSLEMAIRSISWMWTLFLILPSRSLDEDSLRRICKSLFAQLDHVCRYPSTYSSPNTHLIGEAAALFMAGMLFQELRRSERWRQFGAITLINEMQRQVSGDGVYREASVYYHCYAADFYLQALALAKWNRAPFPEWMWSRLSQMLEFLLHVTQPDGAIPLAGDDDGGRALALGADHYGRFTDGLSTGAVLFGRPDFKYQARAFHEETLWLLGEDAWPIFNSLAAQPPSEHRRFYREAGYLIQRSGWEANDSQVIFDCGGLGMQSGGHGHADALSIVLFSGGRPLLIDPGTSVYNAAPEWRTFFRSTRAHNTVVVDGTSQSIPGGTFDWKQKAETRILQEIATDGIDYIGALHDGYARPPIEITHRRRVAYIRPNYWIVLDDLHGRGEHDFEFLYHLPPAAEITVLGEERHGEADCRVCVNDATLHMFLYASVPFDTEAVCGRTGPIQGWSSARYGQRVPGPVLRVTLRGPAPVGLMSFLMPGDREVASRRFDVGNGAIAGAIRDGAFDDVALMASPDTEVQLIDCSMRGEFFWMRMRNGVLCQLFAVNAHSFSHAGETVFESAAVIPYVQAYLWEDGMVIERGGQEGKVYVRDLRDRQFQRH